MWCVGSRSTLFLLALVWSSTSWLAAAPQVELELATGAGTPLTAPRRWYEIWAKLGLEELRIRQWKPGDEIEIVAHGRGESAVYQVTGLIDARGNVRLPGGTFSARDRAGLSDWLARVRSGALTEEKPAVELPWGLTAEQFIELRGVLAAPVEFSTQGVGRLQVYGRLRSQLAVPLSVDPAAVDLIRTDDVVSSELHGVSLGTALSFLLRKPQLGFSPRHDPRHGVDLFVERLTVCEEPWPVGWPVAKKDRSIVPKRFEFVDARISDVSLESAIQSVAGRLDVAVLWDPLALDRWNVDREAILVSVPTRRQAYYRLIDRLLSPVHLVDNVRLDEAGRPFLWITSAN